MAEVTIMVLKVDLQCFKCYKKVKKVLCKFPQIRDQVFDEKQNTVTIKVVYCCPEKLKQKISCKGGKSIKSIEIKKPEKPKESEKKKESEKPKESEKKKEPEKPKESEKKESEKPKEPDKKKEPEKPKEKPADPPKQDKPKVTFIDPPPKQKQQAQTQPKPLEAVVIKAPEPVPGYPPGYPNYPFEVYSRECSEGQGGACQQLGYGGPLCYYGGYYGRPVYDSWGGGGGCSSGYYKDRGDYLSEENPSTCTIM